MDQGNCGMAYELLLADGREPGQIEDPKASDFLMFESMVRLSGTHEEVARKAAKMSELLQRAGVSTHIRTRTVILL
jgi:hypothetical protein